MSKLVFFFFLHLLLLSAPQTSLNDILFFMVYFNVSPTPLDFIASGCIIFHFIVLVPLL